MNLRRSYGHTGLTEEISGSQIPFTGVAFRDVSDTVRELGQDLDDGLSSSVGSEGSSFRQRSLASRSAWSSSSGHGTVDADGVISIALEEYAFVSCSLENTLLTLVSGFIDQLLYLEQTRQIP